jgi:DNA-binding NarL/FixJ family response regulator
MARDKIKVMIVDDHQMVRDGIRIMLESQTKRFQFEITEAEDGESAINKLVKENFDIVLMDYQLPTITGAETVHNMLLYKRETKVLALSNYDEFTYITDMLKAGAKGYVLKNIGPDELLNAIETILGGKNYYSNDVAVKLIDVNSQSKKIIRGKRKNHGVTKREIEILKFIAGGLTNEVIAKKLKLSKRTVDSHRQNLLNKLGVNNTAGLLKSAYDLKLMQF